MKVTYFDIAEQAVLETEKSNFDEFKTLFEALKSQFNEAGHPTAELRAVDGTSLSLSFEEDHAYVVWIAPDRRSYSSYSGRFESGFTFNYMGSWSEAPAQGVIPLNDALESVSRFISDGDPRTPHFEFSID